MLMFWCWCLFHRARHRRSQRVPVWPIPIPIQKFCLHYCTAWTLDIHIWLRLFCYHYRCRWSAGIPSSSFVLHQDREHQLGSRLMMLNPIFVFSFHQPAMQPRVGPVVHGSPLNQPYFQFSLVAYFQAILKQISASTQRNGVRLSSIALVFKKIWLPKFKLVGIKLKCVFGEERLGKPYCRHRDWYDFLVNR